MQALGAQLLFLFELLLSTRQGSGTPFEPDSNCAGERRPDAKALDVTVVAAREHERRSEHGVENLALLERDQN